MSTKSKFRSNSGGVPISSKRKERSPALVLKLQQQLKEQQALAKQLRKANETLKEYEASLSATIGALGDGLYYLAQVLIECPASQISSSSSAGSSRNSSLVEALAQDLEAAKLLELIGKYTISAESSLTSRSMRSGCTAARVRGAQTLLAADPAAFERQVAQKLQHLTFRMSYHLSVAADSSKSSKKDKLQLLQHSMDDIAVEYVESVMLLFCVDGMLLLRMCMLNLDTLQEASPSPTLFEDVADAMRFTKDQIRQFTAAARADQQKRAVLARNMAQLVAQIQQLLDPQDNTAVEAAAPSPASAAADAGGAKLQLQADAASNGNISRGSMASASASTNTISCGAALKHKSSFEGSSSNAFHPAPWQRFGLASSALAFEQDTLHKVDELLVLLQRDLVMWRVLSHNMTVLFLNSSTNEQLARATVTAYPFFLRPMQVIQCALRQAEGNL